MPNCVTCNLRVDSVGACQFELNGKPHVCTDALKSEMERHERLSNADTQIIADLNKRLSVANLQVSELVDALAPFALHGMGLNINEADSRMDQVYDNGKSSLRIGAFWDAIQSIKKHEPSDSGTCPDCSGKGHNRTEIPAPPCARCKGTGMLQNSSVTCTCPEVKLKGGEKAKCPACLASHSPTRPSAKCMKGILDCTGTHGCSLLEGHEGRHQNAFNGKTWE